MMLFWAGVTLALFILILTAALNTLTFPRLRPAASPKSRPKVSILMPARNEAAVIERTVRALLAQSYTHYELIILDDHSNDGTGDLAQAAAKGDSRLRVLKGETLPAGWLGKNWACHQLSQSAIGDLLLFTDADVEWTPDALQALVAAQTRSCYDLLSVWPTQKTVTWGERLCVSLIALVIFAYLPEFMVRFSPWAIFAAANGQCLLFTRAMYARVGGHQAVRANITEDVGLARAVKRVGGRLMTLDGNRLILCRMYTSWAGVRDGFAKNILAGHGNSLAFLAFSTFFHWSLFVAPWLWLISGGGAAYPLYPLTLIGLGVGLRALTAHTTHQRALDALLMPLSVLLMTRIALQAAWWQVRYGGPRWKGRIFIKEAKHG
jgi:chlorobactene glucosyltransferase